jgi:hypothetical protein
LGNHCALGEIEHAGGLEDQHEAERDQRIQHAGHQPAEHDFDEESHSLSACLVLRCEAAAQ